MEHSPHSGGRIHKIQSPFRHSAGLCVPQKQSSERGAEINIRRKSVVDVSGRRSGLISLPTTPLSGRGREKSACIRIQLAFAAPPSTKEARSRCFGDALTICVYRAQKSCLPATTKDSNCCSPRRVNSKIIIIIMRRRNPPFIPSYPPLQFLACSALHSNLFSTRVLYESHIQQQRTFSPSNNLPCAQ